VNPKQRPNHQRYLQILKRLTPEQRLLKAFELSAFTKSLFVEGLRKTVSRYWARGVPKNPISPVGKMSQQELLKQVVPVLTAAGIDYGNRVDSVEHARRTSFDSRYRSGYCNAPDCRSHV
jgi:hypothetical protein